MKRLTQKDDQGNWSLRGVPWKSLHEGKAITKELWERLYGALWKLMEYEDTGLTPGQVEQLKESKRWIPVEERLPEEGITVWVIVKRPEWISEYIPAGEWEYHPESYGTYKGKYEEGVWQFENEKNEWICCNGEPGEARDLEAIYNTVTAWMLLPEPYKPENQDFDEGSTDGTVL